MDGAAIILAFKIYYDRITSFSAPGYEQSEILLFLNNAQDEFIKNRTFGQNFQPPALEDNEKRVADISPLIDTIGDANVIMDTRYGISWKLAKSHLTSDRMMWIVEARVSISRTAYPYVNGEWTKCELIKSENASKFITNTVNKTHFINPKYFQDTANIWFIGDTYSEDLDEVRLTYIKRPYPIIPTIGEYDGTYGATKMSLVPEVHQEIVNIAVRQALQVTQDPRWKTSVTEQQIKTE